jgi:hypothetical protein
MNRKPRPKKRQVEKIKSPAQEWCEKCTIFKENISSLMIGCCRNEPNHCPKFCKGGCCFNPNIKPNLVTITPLPSLPDKRFPPPKSAGTWICPECQVHTDTTPLMYLSKWGRPVWVKRKCNVCENVYTSAAFVDEQISPHPISCKCSTAVI